MFDVRINCKPMRKNVNAIYLHLKIKTIEYKIKFVNNFIKKTNYLNLLHSLTINLYLVTNRKYFIFYYYVFDLRDIF